MNKNVSHTKSSYDPLNYNMQATNNNTNPKVKKDMRTTNTIFGEPGNEKAHWLDNGVSKKSYNTNMF